MTASMDFLTIFANDLAHLLGGWWLVWGVLFLAPAPWFLWGIFQAGKKDWKDIEVEVDK